MRYISAALCLLLASNLVLAQAPDKPEAEATAAAAAMDPETRQAHEDLRELRRVMETALNNRDVDALLANVDDRVVFTTMNGDVARGKEGIREYYEKMLNGPGKVVKSVTTSFEPDDLSLLYGDNHMAIAFGHTNDHYVLTSGKEFDIHARWSGTMLRRDDGKWNVASFHYSANIFDNPILNEQRRILIMVAVGLAIVAAGLAFWLGRRRRATG